MNEEHVNLSASELIERMESEAGCRVDDNGYDNLAMAGLMGALSRIMGQSPPTYKERDDIAVGLLINHQMSPEYEAEQMRKEMMASMVISGISPDELKVIFGK